MDFGALGLLTAIFVVNTGIFLRLGRIGQVLKDHERRIMKMEKSYVENVLQPAP